MARWRWTPLSLVVVLGVSTALAASSTPPVMDTFSVADEAPVPTSLRFDQAPAEVDPGDPFDVVVELRAGDERAGSTTEVTLSAVGVGDASGSLTCSDLSVPPAAGLATFEDCSIDRGGSYQLTARLSLLQVSREVVVTGPAVLDFLDDPSGGAAGAAWSTQPRLVVTDAEGTQLVATDQRFGLVIKPGTGAPGATLSCTDNPLESTDGIAAFAGCRIDKPGTGYRLLALAEDDVVAGTSAAFDVTGGTASGLRFSTQPVGGATGGIAVQPVVDVVDAGGNRMTGSTASVALTLSTNSNGAALTCPTNPVSAVEGRAAFTGCTVDRAGSYTITATAASLSGISDSFTVVPSSVGQLAFTTQPGSGTGGAALDRQPAVRLFDDGGHPVSGAVTLGLSGGTAGAALVCDANPATSAGDTATFSGCRVSLAGSGYRLTATSGTATVQSDVFDVSVGSVHRLAFTSAPSEAVGGAALTTPVVRATDAGGNLVSATVTLSLVPGLGDPDATLTCATSPASTVGGVASFPGCSIDRAGPGYRLQARVASPTTAVATTEPFTVAVGAPQQLAFETSPGGGTGGTPWAQQPVVTVLDAGGNRVADSDAQVDLAVSPSSGTLTCAADPLPVTGGAAAFTGCAVDRARNGYTLTASASGLSSATSQPFDIGVGAPNRLEFRTQPGRGAPGTALVRQPVVVVADAGGNVVTAATGSVALDLTSGTGTDGAALACSPRAVDDGVATFAGCAVSQAAGGYTLTARAGALRAESLPFNVVLPSSTLEQSPTPVPLNQTFGGRLYANNPTDVQDLVNTRSGALTTSVLDLEVAGVGHDLLLERTYTSSDPSTGAFGVGWSSVLDVAVAVSDDGRRAVVRGEDGQRVTFTRSKPSSSWVAPPGARSSLACTAKTCTVTRFDQTAFTVSGSQLVSYLDQNGQGLRFAYTGTALSSILLSTRDAKRSLAVAVSTDADGRVTLLRTPTGREVRYGYADSRLTSVLDVRGGTWSYGYADGRLSSITSPDGIRRLTATYVDGKVASVRRTGSPRQLDADFDWSGTQATRTVRTTIDGVDSTAVYRDVYSNGALVRQEFPTGATMRYGYDSRMNLVQVQDPAGWVQRMTYDVAGNLTSQSSPISSSSTSTLRLTYDAQHRMTSQTDANGKTVVYVYNGPNLGAIRPPGPGAGATRLSYDTLGLLTGITTTKGVQLYSHDDAGNQIGVRSTTLDGLPVNGDGTVSTFDEAGRQLTLRTALGIESSWTYDAAGNVLSASTPAGSSATTYDAAGDVRVATRFGETTTYTWSEGTRTSTSTGPEGTTRQTFDSSGNVLEESAPTGLLTQHVYDGLGREVSTISGVTTVRHTFDDNSNVVAIDDSAGFSVRQQFDALNRQIRNVTDGVETRTGYDPVGNVTTTWDERGGTTSRVYDDHGNPRSVTDSAGTTSYAYDLADNVVQRTDGRGGVTSWSYDAMSRPVSMSVGGNTETYEYDLDGRLRRTTDAEGRTATRTLDEAGRPTLVQYRGEGYAPVDVAQGYDERGRRTSLDGEPVTYDDRGNVTREADFRYDRSQPGRVLETYPDGTVVTYRVDGSGNLMSLSTGTPGSAGFVEASYVRDDAGRATGLALSNGVLQSRHLDASGNLLDQSVRRGGTVLAHDSYTWDAAGDRLSQRSSTAGRTVENGYAYDRTGRITGYASELLEGAAAEPLPVSTLPASTEVAGSGPVGLVAPAPPQAPDPGDAIAQPDVSLGYDAVGNRTTDGAGRTWTHGPADQIVTDSAGVTWTYDRTGAVTGRSGGGSSTSYAYDAAARLVRVVHSDGQSVTYTYDGDGNRTSRTQGGVTTTYEWSPFGSLPQLATETTNGATTHYLHGDGPVAARTGTDVLFFHLDPLGSTNAVTDASGALAAAFSYTPFGEVTGTGDRADDVTLLFQAQQLDRTSGLYNMRARQYDPETGRFTQREPAPTAVGVPLVSAYAFVGNRPTALTDPTGRTPSTTTVFAGQATDEANAAKNTTYALKATGLAVKAVSKIGGYSAALAAASANSGAQLTKAAEVGKKLKFAGIALAVIGIAVQAYVVAETCQHGSLQKCIAGATGLALNIGFTVGCTFITSGAGSAACAICGAIIGIALEYVIGEYGDEIVAGLIVFGALTEEGWNIASAETAAAFTLAGNEIAAFTTSAIGNLVLGADAALFAATLAFADALDVLSDAGISVVEMAEMISDVFLLGVHETAAALLDLGYSVAGLAESLAQSLGQTAEETAALLADGFGVAAATVAAALNDAYTLTAAQLTALLVGVDVAVADIARALGELTTLTDQAVAEALQTAGFAVQAVGAALTDGLELLEDAVTQVLADMDYAVLEVAEVLRDILLQVDTEVAELLKDAGFIVTDVADALLGVYADTAAAAAAALAAAGYLAGEVAAGLEDAYDATAAAVTQLLKDVDFTALQIAGALTSVFTSTTEAIADLLHDVGFTVTEVAGAIAAAFTDAAADAAALLLQVGFAIDEIAIALQGTFDVLAGEAVLILKDLGATAIQLALALQDAYDATATAMAMVLDTAEIALNEVALALQTVYGQTAAAAAQVLEDAGYEFVEIGTALMDVFGQTAAETAALLQDIGALAADVVAALGDLGTDVLNGILLGAGYTEDLINDIGGAFEDFGSDVEDFFGSLF